MRFAAAHEVRCWHLATRRHVRWLVKADAASSHLLAKSASHHLCEMRRYSRSNTSAAASWNRSRKNRR